MLYNSPRNDYIVERQNPTDIAHGAFSSHRNALRVILYEPSSLHTRNRSYAKSEYFVNDLSASQEGVKQLIFISTMVRGVRRPQAIVLLQSHILSENHWSLHESTMNDAISDSVTRLLCPRARVLCAVYDCEVYTLVA